MDAKPLDCARGGRPEVGGDMGRIGARTLPCGKCVRAARSEVRISRSRSGRRRSVVPIDRETRFVGRSRTHPAREHVRHAEHYVRSDLRRRGRNRRQHREGNEPRGGVQRPVERQRRAGRLQLQRRDRPQAAGWCAHRRTQARRLISRHRTDRPDDVAREGAADVVSQRSSLGQPDEIRRRRGVPLSRRRPGISSMRSM